MDVVYNIVLVLHFVGLAMVLGAFLVQLTAKEKGVTRWMFDGAMTSLLTGLIMVGMVEGGAVEGSVDHVKIGIKLVIVVIIAILAAVGRRRQPPQTALWLAIGLLALANVVIAVFV